MRTVYAQKRPRSEAVQTRDYGSNEEMCTVKNQRNMDLVDKQLQYKELFGIGKDKVAVAGWNKHCKIVNQPGGT